MQGLNQNSMTLFLVFLTLLSTFLYRLQAQSGSRAAAAIFFIFLGTMGNPVIVGFRFSKNNGLGIGEINTIFTFIFLGFALFEVILASASKKWTKKEKQIFFGLFFICIMYLAWTFVVGGAFDFSDFILLTVLLLILRLRPNSSDLRYLPFLARTVIAILGLLALFKYQSPDYKFGLRDYGLSGPYHNFVWDLFGFTERYRGPYQHPNSLGMYVALLTAILFLKKSIWNFPTLLVSFFLLAISASRTSLISMTLGISSFFYVQMVQSKKLDSFTYRTSELSQKTGSFLWKRPLVLFPVITFVSFLTSLIIGNNLTFTGRTVSYREVLRESLNSNVLIGRGPAIFEVNGVENTLITLFSYYGILGLIALGFCVFPFFRMYRSTAQNDRKFFRMMQTMFLISGTGEFFLTGASVDPGFAYVLLALISSRVKNESLG